MAESDDFQVIISKAKDDEDTLILTSKEQAQQWLEQAMYKFNNNHHQYSTYLKEDNLGKSIVTEEEISMLADNPQNDLGKIKRINSLCRYFINKDDLIGKIYETIESNINTDIRNFYTDYPQAKQAKFKKAKNIIDDFNEQINVKQLLRKSVPLTYSSGNYIMYLRKNEGSYGIDNYPLGVVDVSDYEFDGEPVLLIDINELKSRLQKTHKKLKNGKNLFFKGIDEEIKNNYPPEVYDAFIKKERYAKLDIRSSGIMRINNMNRKYGVTPIFRAIKSATMLETFERTDRINAKARAKKIIFQQLRKEVMGKDFDKPAFEEMSYAHDLFMQAWKRDIVIYTGPAFVEDIKYIEPKVENTSIDTLNNYRSKIMTTLGIGFLNQDSKQTFTVANISIRELMKVIHKITEQFEAILEKWYKVVLTNNGIPLEFCPKVKISHSEEMELEIKKDLVELLYSKLNCSFETAYSLLGIDIEDELQKRRKENESGYEEVFTPRQSIYTTTDKGKVGAPVDNKNPDKQVQDQDRRNSE